MMTMPKFEFDETLCIKCWACEVACKAWHDIPANEMGYRVVEETDEGTFPDVKRHFRSIARSGCDLCASNGGRPRCALTCPTGALRWAN